MTITAALATALAALSEAQDEPGADIARSLDMLCVDAAAAVPSFLGLSIVVPEKDPPMTITTFVDGAGAQDIRTSLHVTLGSARTGGVSASVDLILYGGAPGGFVDLAADMAWLTGRPLRDVTLDEHRTLPVATDLAAQIQATSTVNQALGVLIGRGHTPAEAERQLQMIAGAHRADRHTAARIVLDQIDTEGDTFDTPTR